MSGRHLLTSIRPEDASNGRPGGRRGLSPFPNTAIRMELYVIRCPQQQIILNQRKIKFTAQI